MTKATQNKLTPKEQKFVHGYCGAFKFNGKLAALAAGYSEKTAGVIASENLSKPKIKMAIQEQLQKQAFEFDEVTRQIVAEYTKIAFSDFSRFVGLDGRIRFKNLEDAPEDIRACIKKIKINDSGVEVELYSKEKALQELAKITGLSMETKREVGVNYETLIERLQGGR